MRVKSGAFDVGVLAQADCAPCDVAAASQRDTPTQPPRLPVTALNTGTVLSDVIGSLSPFVMLPARTASISTPPV